MTPTSRATMKSSTLAGGTVVASSENRVRAVPCRLVKESDFARHSASIPVLPQEAIRGTPPPWQDNCASRVVYST